jgi:hypothetical protein
MVINTDLTEYIKRLHKTIYRDLLRNLVNPGIYGKNLPDVDEDE